MLLKTIDSRIKQAFSDAALQYDVLSSLHREIGRELTSRLQAKDNIQSILDIGMGTGWFTNRLKNIFPEACVIGIDFADGMIEQAKKKEGGFKIVQADAQFMPFKPESFDLITSNLAYQWIDDLKKGFGDCFDLLKAGGALEMTMFGYQTLDELFVSIEKSFFVKDKKEKLPFKRLASCAYIKEQLSRTGFTSVEVDYERIKVRFPDMMALVYWIKNIGANRAQSNLFIGKDLLQRASEYYNQYFSDRLGTYATFEVVWVQANKQ